MSKSIDVLAVMDREAKIARHYSIESGAHKVAEDASEDAAAARAAVAELIEMAAMVVAQAKEGREVDVIALADCIDLAGGKAARKAARARVKGGAA